MSRPKNIVVLWDNEIDLEKNNPFKDRSLDDTYSYVAKLVRERGNRLFVSHYNEYNNGNLDKAYLHDGKWVEKTDVPVDVVFDKYEFNKETVLLKQEIESAHPVINNFELEKIAKDKLLSAQEFSEQHPKTCAATKQTVEDMLENHGKVVLKPLYDFGGRGVKVIEDISEYEDKRNYIVQQFIDSSKGIEELDIQGAHDLRVVLVDGKPVLSYIRQPETGLISNVSRGGSMKFIELEDVPDAARDIVKEVSEDLSSFQPAIFGVDMIFDRDQKPWILELNSKPGLNYYQDKEIKSWKKKYLVETAELLCEIAEN